MSAMFRNRSKRAGAAVVAAAQQGGDPAEITRRQKQIITATHNAMRPKDKSATPENAKYLSDTENTLKTQVESLVARAAARELTDNASVQEFAKEMKAAADAMAPASDKLKSQAMEGRDRAGRKGPESPGARRSHLSRYSGCLRAQWRRRRGRRRRECRPRSRQPVRPRVGHAEEPV